MQVNSKIVKLIAEELILESPEQEMLAMVSASKSNEEFNIISIV